MEPILRIKATSPIWKTEGPAGTLVRQSLKYDELQDPSAFAILAISLAPNYKTYINGGLS